MALSADELKQLQQWYGGGQSSGLDSTTVGGQTYGTLGVSSTTDAGNSYRPNTLINYDPTKLGPKDNYNIIDPSSGDVSGTGQFLDGGGLDGIGMLTLALITGGALGAFDGVLGGVGGGSGGATVGGSAGYLSPGEMDQLLASQVAGGGGVGGGTAAGAASYFSPGEVDQVLANEVAGNGGVLGPGVGSTVSSVFNAAKDSQLASSQLGLTAADVTAGGIPSVGMPGNLPYVPGSGTIPGGGPGTIPGGGPGTVPGLTDLAKGVAGVVSGVTGQSTANNIAHQSDPFAQYRDMFGKKLVDLWNDPSTITKMPGYQAGMTAVERSLGSQGYTGSGNMMASLQQYGGGFFDKTLSELATLSGATTTPGNGALGAANLAGQGQGSIGYGINSLLNYFTGNSAGQGGSANSTSQQTTAEGFTY